MAHTTLERVLREVEVLTPQEQHALRKQLDNPLGRAPAESLEDELEQRLFENGLLSELRPPITDLTPYQSREPKKAKGQPVSQLIVEERR